MNLKNSDFLPALYDAIKGNDYRRVSELYDHYNDTPSLRAIAPTEETQDLFGAWFEAHRALQTADRLRLRCRRMLSNYQNVSTT